MDEYTVRELREGDFEHGIFETLSNLKDSPRPEFERAKDIFAKIRAQNGTVFVAALGDEIVGTATVLIEHKLLAGGIRCAHIEDVATRAGYERRGIGRAIIAAAIAHAKTHHCYKVILDCSDENVPFYEKLGFTKRHNEMIIKL